MPEIEKPEVDAPDELKQVFWASFIQWAGSDRGFQAAYADATGEALTFKVEPGTTRDAVERELIARMHRFVEWLTREHYGLEYAPKAYRDHVEGKKS